MVQKNTYLTYCATSKEVGVILRGKTSTSCRVETTGEADSIAMEAVMTQKTEKSDDRK